MAIKAVSGAALVAPALFIWKCCNLQEWLDKLGRYGPSHPLVAFSFLFAMQLPV